MAYTTLAAAHTELNIPTLTTGDDALLSGYITTAQRIIEAPPPLGTGRVFEAAADTTRYVDAPSNPTRRDLHLWDIGDLCAITTITNGDGVVIPATEYTTKPRYKTPYWSIVLNIGSSYAWAWTTTPEAAIAIVGKWAYSTSAPADIARAALRLVVWMYKSKDSAGADMTPVQTEQGIILPIVLPKDVQAIIQNYWSSI